MSHSLFRLAQEAGVPLDELKAKLTEAGIPWAGHGEQDEARITGFVRKLLSDRAKQERSQ